MYICCVHECTYVCACMYVCVVCMHVYVYMFGSIWVCMCVYIRVWVWLVHKCSCVDVHTSTRTFVCVCSCAYMHTYKHRCLETRGGAECSGSRVAGGCGLLDMGVRNCALVLWITASPLNWSATALAMPFHSCYRSDFLSSFFFPRAELKQKVSSAYVFKGFIHPLLPRVILLDTEF